MKPTYQTITCYLLYLCLLTPMGFYSCSSQVETTENALDLSNMELDLHIDFSKGKYPLGQGTEKLIAEITTFVFSESLQPYERAKRLKIRKNKEELWIQLVEVDDISTNIQKMMIDPCETQKKVCYSERCVRETLTDIIGDGDRDVDIQLRRGAISITISYTYQDC